MYIILCLAASHLTGQQSRCQRRIMKLTFPLRGLRSSVTAGEAPPFQLVLMRPARTLCGFSSLLSEQDLERLSHIEVWLFFFFFFFFEVKLHKNMSAKPRIINPFLHTVCKDLHVIALL